MKLQTRRFGEIEVADDCLLTFPEGLPGFPEEKSFVLLPYEEGSLFSFLQSAQEPDLIFFVTNPFHFFPEYEFQLEEEFLQDMELSEENFPQVLSILTIPENLEDMTANLLAPIIINAKSRKAKQVVLEKTDYTVKHKIFPHGLPKMAQEGK